MTDVATDGVSVRAFAQQVGRSHVAILKRIKAGDIPRNADGTIPLAEGLKAFAAFEKRSPAKKAAPKKAPAKPAATKPKAVAKKAPTASVKTIDDEPGDTLAPTVGEASAVATAYNKAKLAEKTYQAKLKELEFKLRKREIIPRSEVEEQVEALAVKVRGKLLAVPVRVAVMCEGRPAREIEDIFATAIDEALADMQKGLTGL
jgi:hypothetical protein